MKALALIGCVALFIATVAAAQDKHPADGSPNGGAIVTAEEIHKGLTNYAIDPTKLSAVEMMGSLYAGGYTLGVADSENNDLFCIPAGVSKQEIFAVVEKFLNEHPDGWHQPAPVEISVALRLSYPCKGA